MAEEEDDVLPVKKKVNMGKKSAKSMESPLQFARTKKEKLPDDTSSPAAEELHNHCESILSVKSMEQPLRFSSEETQVFPGDIHDPKTRPLLLNSDSSKEIYNRKPSQPKRVPSHSFAPQSKQQPNLDIFFLLLEKTVLDFASEELLRFKTTWTDELFDQEHVFEEDEIIRKEFLKIILHFVEGLDPETEHSLNIRRQSAILQSQLKRHLQRKCETVFEGINKPGSSSVLNEIYTELYITEGGTAQVNSEHEVRQIEGASSKQTTAEANMKPEDILKYTPGRNSIRTVLTNGVAGIGKTVLTQKFTLDWAEGRANQDIDFLFPFSFRELNLVREKRFSLLGLLHYFFQETKGMGKSSLESSQVVIILNGLDECRLPLDFHGKLLNDVHESATVDVLLTNIIKGNLLPLARLWITTRPAAAIQIPPEYVDLVTEIRGFTNAQKEEYFRKRFRDHEHAPDIISHIKASQSLYVMCHIPIFCWITATVLGDLLKTIKHSDLPQTLTEMYIHFLVVQSKLRSIKYKQHSHTDSLWDPLSKTVIESLGKLAFEQLQKGNYVFYESDLTEIGLDVQQASVYSGVFTQAFTEHRGLYLEKVFGFVHLSVQEFFAALYVHMTFFSSGVNLLVQGDPCHETGVVDEKTTLKRFYQSAAKEALKSPNGHLDLFLRFLLGLSLQSNQKLLQGLLTETTSESWNSQRAAKVIKKNSSHSFSSERLTNLFYCLNEVNDRSVVEEIQQQLRSGHLAANQASHWSTLAFTLLSSEDDLAVFDLSKYSSTSEEVLLRTLPLIQASKVALIRNVKFSERSISALSSGLSCKSSCLRELDLTKSNVQDSGKTSVGRTHLSPLPTRISQLVGVSDHRGRLPFPGFSSELPLLSPQTSGSKLQSSRRNWKEGSVISTEELQVQDGPWRCGEVTTGAKEIFLQLLHGPKHNKPPHQTDHQQPKGPLCVTDSVLSRQCSPIRAKTSAAV